MSIGEAGQQAIAWLTGLLSDPASAKTVTISRISGGPLRTDYECFVDGFTATLSKEQYPSARGSIGRYGGSVRTEYADAHRLEVEDASGTVVAAAFGTNLVGELYALAAEAYSQRTVAQRQSFVDSLPPVAVASNDVGLE